MTYKEQMRDPKWIEFAHDFKKARNWTCEVCGTRQKLGDDLTVHHIYYLSFVRVWEHPEALLECLCWDCHKHQQKWQQDELVKFAKKLKGKESPKRTKRIALALKHADELADRRGIIRQYRTDQEVQISHDQLAAEHLNLLPEGYNPYPTYKAENIIWMRIHFGIVGQDEEARKLFHYCRFAGISPEGILELRIPFSLRKNAETLNRTSVQEQYAEKIQSLFPTFKSLNATVGNDPNGGFEQSDEGKSRILALRQMLGG